jgi:DNA-directed RNA polymerase subunit RPC12/RpoP
MDSAFQPFLIFLYIVIGLFFLYCWICIVMKAGYTWAFGLLFLIPVVNLILYILFAFETWPLQMKYRKVRDELAEYKSTTDGEKLETIPQTETPINSMASASINFCSNCGAKLNTVVNFCYQCGYKIAHEKIKHVEQPADKSIQLKETFEDQGKCPYCSSQNIKQKRLKGSYADKLSQEYGYKYTWNSKCLNCGKEWLDVNNYSE